MAEQIEEVEPGRLQDLDALYIPGRFLKVLVLAVDHDEGTLKAKLFPVDDELLRLDLRKIEAIEDQQSPLLEFQTQSGLHGGFLHRLGDPEGVGVRFGSEDDTTTPPDRGRSGSRAGPSCAFLTPWLLGAAPDFASGFRTGGSSPPGSELHPDDHMEEVVLGLQGKDLIREQDLSNLISIQVQYVHGGHRVSVIPLQLDLNIHARRKLQLHKGIHGLLCGFENVQKAFVRTDFELLTRLLVDVGGP